MSSLLLKIITNRYIKKLQFDIGTEDPYYEYVEIGDGNEKLVRKKIARRIPQGISNHDEFIMEKVKRKAYRYDMLFSIIGFKFGLLSLANLIPFVGPLLTVYWSLSILLTARQLSEGLPLKLNILFIINILIDVALSFIPFIGSVVVVAYKANLRNCLLLEKYLTSVGKQNMERAYNRKIPMRASDASHYAHEKGQQNLNEMDMKTLSLLHRKPSASSFMTALSALYSLPPTIVNSPVTVTSTVTSVYNSFENDLISSSPKSLLEERKTK